MLTASRAFQGDDPTQAIASVLRSDPDWTRLPADTPESIRRVLRRCLEKDRRRRLGDVRDACLDIEEAQRVPGPQVRAAGAIGRRERLMWIAAIVAVAMLGAGWSIVRRPAPLTPARQVRVEITTPASPDPVSLALSPDGEKLAFVAFAEGRRQLWVRMIESGSRSTAARHGRRGVSILVTGQPVDRLFRGGEDPARRSQRQCAGRHRSGGHRSGWNVESRRRHPVFHGPGQPRVPHVRDRR